MVKLKCGFIACVCNMDGECKSTEPVEMEAFFEGDFGVQGTCKDCGAFLPSFEGQRCKNFKWKEGMGPVKEEKKDEEV